MNSNNWLSFPLSPPHSSLPTHIHASHPHHHFSLGLVSDTMDNPIFQPQEWSLMNGQSCNSTSGGGDQVPKVADFLGVSSIKCDHQENDQSSSEKHHLQVVGFNESDYLFPSTSVVPLQNGGVVAATNYDQFQESGSNLQSLTLSMGGGAVGGGTSSASGKGNSTCETSGDNSTNNNSNAVVAVVEPTAPRRTLDTFGQRTSIYRGVTRHRWTGRYEAHLWDNTCRREGQSRKGRQVYLGGYDKEEKAARAYDLAALKYWGTSTTTNFPISNYEKEVEEMKNMTRQEFVASIRRKSSGFSRGASMYRGVTRHHQHGRWQARIGRVAGNKDLYLGTFSTEEEAAEAYDIAAIKFRGLNAVTNFDMTRYDVKSILESNSLPIGGGAAKRLKEAQAIETSRKREEMIALGSSSSALPYGILSTTPSSSSTWLQSSSPYSLMQSTPYDHPHHQLQPFLTLQNQAQDSSNISQLYTTNVQDASNNYKNYLQTQLHLHQQSMQVLQHSQPHQQQQLYNSYIQSNSGLMHGLWNMGMESSGSGYGSLGGNSSGGSNGGGGGGGDQDQPAAGLVKVDYDQLPTGGGGFGNWSGESGVQGSNPGVFTMWNE